MKIKTIALLSLLLPIGVIAQEKDNTQSFYDTSYKMRNSGSFGSSTNLLTFSYGFPCTIHGSINGVRDPNRLVIGPIKANYEFSVHDEIGIAAKFLYVHGTRQDTDWFGYTTRMRISAWAVGLSGYYHFNKLIPVKALDLYAGVGFYIGMQRSIWDINYPTDADNGVIWTPTFTIGGRYYFSQSFGVYSELGLTGGSIIDLGVTFRLH